MVCSRVVMLVHCFKFLLWWDRTEKITHTPNTGNHHSMFYCIWVWHFQFPHASGIIQYLSFCAEPISLVSMSSVKFSSVQSFSHVWLFATPWTVAHHTSLSITNSQSLLKFTCIRLVMPSNHLILCSTLLLLPSIFSSIRVFSKESVLCIRWPKYWNFSFSISPPNE